jgi:uncharacterized protein DUF4123
MSGADAMDAPPSSTSTSLVTEATAIVALRALARAGSLFAILDACDEPAVPPRVQQLGEERGVSLYRGTAEEQYADIAPYLVALDDMMIDWLLGTLWGEPWGIFVISDAGLAALRTHFRKFLLVDAPSGDQWYFRFYDPRVLAKYLPTCTIEELRAFYGRAGPAGVVQAYGIPDPDHGVRLTRLATPQEAWQAEHRPRVVLKKPGT